MNKIIQETQPAIKRYTWADTEQMTRSLAKKITAAKYLPDAIVAILRGGCVPAVHLSHLIDVRPFYALNLQTTISDGVRAARQRPAIVSHSGFDALAGKNVLIVDDVTNTGATLTVARQYIKRYSPAAIRMAILVWDTVPPKNRTKVQDVKADFWITKVHAWVLFPWNE